MSNDKLAGGRHSFDFSDEQKLNWLRLYRSQNVGPATFRDLISHFGTAAAALEALPELAKRGGASARIKIYPKDKAEMEISRANSIGANFIALGETGYPPLLRHLEHSPPILCVKGNTDILKRNGLSIVGSRNASISGLKITERFAKQASDNGLAVISGLARGIDTAAHTASLSNGTIAVFAGGLDIVFPPQNKALSESIVENGGILVSEMPLSWQPVARDFPRRNRIITGLANAVLVVEAAKRSGSLITARLANEAGRLVLAVPGSPLDPRSEGTNGLIREGATLIRSFEDILEALTPINQNRNEFIFDINESEDDSLYYENLEITQSNESSHDVRSKVINHLNQTPVDVDDIVRLCSVPHGDVQLVLLELKLAGKIQRHSGNRISLIEAP